MYDIKLPDGTWVTSPMWAGIGKIKDQCVPEEHSWEVQGEPRLPEETGEVPVQIERCSRCGWVRGRYLENPHSEVGDGGVRGQDNPTCSETL